MQFYSNYFILRTIKTDDVYNENTNKLQYHYFKDCDTSLLEVMPHSTLNCSEDETSMTTCHVFCETGFMLVENVYNEVFCGHTTQWDWNFDQDRYNLPSCVGKNLYNHNNNGIFDEGVTTS